VQCRQCGTEIADKAIVCYRCGRATTDPVRKPAPIGQTSGRGPSLVVPVLVLVLAAALLLWPATANARIMQVAGGLLAAVGALLLIARLMRRR